MFREQWNNCGRWGRVLDVLWRRQSTEEIEWRLQDSVAIKGDQSMQKDWAKIDKSSYCSHLKEIKEDREMEKYWGREDVKM